MNNFSAWDLSPEELMKRAVKIFASASFATSGLVIDPTAPYLCTDAQYIKGVLLARLEGKTPPFKDGDRVETIDRCGSLRYDPDAYLEKGWIGTVERSVYFGKDVWGIALRRVTSESYVEPLFDPSCFRLCQQVVTEVT